ncbi:TetR/AcrR family transcriptional regulator [Nocardia macrotermitis]|uniref:HTH tetR-type domain-containing protein n=1 Tax=Nocardia macrotermitis TaxID=2585198 RepID=A0A7K0D4T3_9NOCA|nr:TetR/AcrR family transcriptional regulator [Nocardia macrotermitis]MQY20342.1 hypothetical protein [Nocardia macrotermitis]
MSAEVTGAAGPRPPQQERSREALRKVLAAAEDILRTEGPDAFTMAGVAERAGVSVGAVYRRFAGREELVNAVKDRLIDNMESELSAALAAADDSLEGVVDAFAGAIVRGLSAGTDVFPHLLSGKGGEAKQERTGRAVAVMQRLFLDAAGAHAAQVRRADPVTALATVFRVLLGGCIHRMLTVQNVPDGISWQRWIEETSDMAVVYLTTPGRHHE